MKSLQNESKFLIEIEYIFNLVIWLGKAHIPKDKNWKRTQNDQINMKMKNINIIVLNKGNLYTLIN